MGSSSDAETSIPLVQEQLTVKKRAVETGRVRIHTVVDERLVRVAEDLERDDVSIERVPVNEEVTNPPQPREENGVLIIPILEEVVVVEKRLVLKEELHVHRNRKRERVEEAVRLRGMHAEVQRVVADERAERDRSERKPDGTPALKPRLRRKDRLTGRDR